MHTLRKLPTAKPNRAAMPTMTVCMENNCGDEWYVCQHASAWSGNPIPGRAGFKPARSPAEVFSPLLDRQPLPPVEEMQSLSY
jgi:hypothetical protein